MDIHFASPWLWSVSVGQLWRNLGRPQWFGGDWHAGIFWWGLCETTAACYMFCFGVSQKMWEKIKTVQTFSLHHSSCACPRGWLRTSLRAHRIATCRWQLSFKTWEKSQRERRWDMVGPCCHCIPFTDKGTFVGNSLGGATDPVLWEATAGTHSNTLYSKNQ